MVADADMVQYHGAEAAQRFILTVMNMVSPEARPDPRGLCGLRAEGSGRGRYVLPRLLTGQGRNWVRDRDAHGL